MDFWGNRSSSGLQPRHQRFCERHLCRRRRDAGTTRRDCSHDRRALATALQQPFHLRLGAWALQKRVLARAPAEAGLGWRGEDRRACRLHLGRPL